MMRPGGLKCIVNAFNDISCSICKLLFYTFLSLPRQVARLKEAPNGAEMLRVTFAF